MTKIAQSGAGSWSISQRPGSGSVPTCHRSATLEISIQGFSFLLDPETGHQPASASKAGQSRPTPTSTTKAAARVRDAEKRKSAADENQDPRPTGSRKAGSRPEAERPRGPYVHIEGDPRSPRLVRVVNSNADMAGTTRYKIKNYKYLAFIQSQNKCSWFF